MLELGLKILASYLLGAVNGSLLIGRLRGGIDIRKLGSGNAGATNALRTQGIWFALPAIAIESMMSVPCQHSAVRGSGGLQSL